jgi:hypothetical protein
MSWYAMMVQWNMHECKTALGKSKIAGLTHLPSFKLRGPVALEALDLTDIRVFPDNFEESAFFETRIGKDAAATNISADDLVRHSPI